MECTVYYYLPDGCKAKDLQVDLGVTHCKIKIKGQDKYLVDNDWHKKILVDESLWTVERDESSGKAILQVCITKHVNQNWWSCVWKGHQEVNTGECTPENTKIHELDSETRYHVEKQMYDQRAKETGKKSSDELIKKQELQGFIDAHPEIDWENTKI